MATVKDMKTDRLVDSLICIERMKKEANSKANVYKTELQARGLSAIADRNIRFIRFEGLEGSCSITDTMKLEILNPVQLKRTLPDGLFDSMMDVEVTPVYKPKAKLEKALKAVFNQEYDMEHTLSEFLTKMSVKPDEKQKKVLLKRLKGEYEKDRELLASMFPDADTDWDVELFYIYQIKNMELIRSFLGEDVTREQLQEISRSILVESKTAIKVEEYDRVEEMEE